MDTKKVETTSERFRSLPIEKQEEIKAAILAMFKKPSKPAPATNE